MNVMDLKGTEVKKALINGNLSVAVIGLGKVGLPLALIFANAGVQVKGVDINEKLVNSLNKGILSFYEPKIPELLENGIKTGYFQASTDTTSATEESDVIVLVVPTLIDSKKRPDISAIEKAAEFVGKGLKRGSVVIIESTVPPGTTEGIVKDILESESHMEAGSDFGLAFCPERVQSPQIVDDIIYNYPKIVGGLDDRSTEVASCIYSIINKKGIIPAGSPRVAELEKIVENTYRDVNIAFANELALACEKLGIDVMDVINIANTQPFCNILTPGAGVGGHCIPMDPYYLIDEARKLKFDAKIMNDARGVNDFMPRHVVDLTLDGLEDIGMNIENAKIAILGLSYKENTDDYRYSPSRDVIDNLNKYNVKIRSFDPYVQKVDDDLKIELSNTIDTCVKDVDCIIVVTAHKEFLEMDLNKIKGLTQEKCVFVDGRCVFSPEDVLNSGFVFKGLGRNC